MAFVELGHVGALDFLTRLLHRLHRDEGLADDSGLALRCVDVRVEHVPRRLPLRDGVVASSDHGSVRETRVARMVTALALVAALILLNDRPIVVLVPEAHGLHL